MSELKTHQAKFPTSDLTSIIQKRKILMDSTEQIRIGLLDIYIYPSNVMKNNNCKIQTYENCSNELGKKFFNTHMPHIDGYATWEAYNYVIFRIVKQQLEYFKKRSVCDIS